MTRRMIRCVEGHVFDANVTDKCPACGWTPSQKAASKGKPSQDKQRAFFGLRAAFNSLTGQLDSLQRVIGLKAKPGISAAIVYVAALLICVSIGYALPGSRFWSSSIATKTQSAAPAGGTFQQPAQRAATNARPDNNSVGGQDQTDANSVGKTPNDQSKPPHQTQPARSDDQIEVGGENSRGFGAIAYSASARTWGEGFGYTSRNATERRALKECASDAKDCQVVVSFYQQCGAVADAERGVWGAGLGPTPQLAMRDAIAVCAANSGKDCEIVRVTCTR